MPNEVSRRGFLGHVSASAAALLAAGTLPRRAVAIEPIARVGGPKFKFSLAAYSYRELLTGSSPELTLDDFLVDCAKMNLDGTELTSYYFPPQPTTEYLCHLKQLAFRLGLDISGTAVRNDFCMPPGPRRDEQLAHVKQWVDHAAVLATPVIRIFSGAARDGQSRDEAHKLAVEGIEECCAYAAQRGVFLALENHGGLTDDVDGLLALVRDVQSPWFGVNLDTGNFYSSDIYGDLARVAPYAVNVQVKVVIQPNRGPKVPADFKRLGDIFRAANYRGYIVLEYEEDEDPRIACPRYMDELRAAFA